MNIVLLGKPGCGKGTQGRKILEELGYTSIEAGKILRKEKNSGSPLGEEIALLIDDGNLVPNEMINKMVEDSIDKTKPNGYVFDGYPRTLGQGEYLDRIFKKIKSKIDLVLFFDVNEDILTERILKRGETSGRADDQHYDIIVQRLENYKDITEPLNFYYKDKIHIINGNQNVEDVFEDTMNVIHVEIDKKYKNV